MRASQSLTECLRPSKSKLDKHGDTDGEDPETDDEAVKVGEVDNNGDADVAAADGQGDGRNDEQQVDGHEKDDGANDLRDLAAEGRRDG